MKPPADQASPRPRRRQGRPLGGEAAVGRDSVLSAATRLIQDQPPAQVTIAAVAREAHVDPALVRYYFGSREALLFEVVQQFAERALPDIAASDPAGALEEYVHRTFRFTRSARYMQRLMVEELSGARSPEVREKLRAWNREPVDFYDKLQDDDGGAKLASFDPLFLHLAVIGISDFFVAAQPLIELIAPPGTDFADLARDYERFVVRLLLDGLRKRE